MNAQINGVLEQIREKLLESAWGGAVVTPVPPGVTPDLPMANTAKAADIPDSETDDALDMYLSGMVDSLLNQYDATDEEAADIVFAAIDRAVQDGKIPEMPSDNADPQEIPLWVGKATIANLSRYVNEFARENSEEA
jgi:hypothetical protein